MWGDELDGCFDSPPSHWKHTFTHKLAERLGCEYTNLGTCGASNHKIFRDTVNHLMTQPKPEYLIILWSAWQREEHCEAMSQVREDALKIQRWACMTQISPERTRNLNNVEKERVEKYLKVKNVRQCITSTVTYMLAIQQLCDTMGIKVLQGVFHERMKYNFMSVMHPKHRELRWGEWMDYEGHRMSLLREECKIGLNGITDFYSYSKANHDLKEFGHPDEDAHTGYADILHGCIEKYLM